jgi:GNAT superfamily N-acetyltransferase
LVDSDVEADEGDRYFNEPGLVAFLDYHRDPNSRWADGNDYIYLDYTNVRPSHRKKGLGKRLFNEVLKKYGEDALYDFGKIMNPAVYRMYRQWQRRGLNVTGKNYEGFYRAMRIYEADYRRVAARYMGLR